MARTFWLFCNTRVVIYIIISLFIVLTITGTWLNGECAVYQPLGPGFDSQVPQTLFHIFSNIFTCSACPEFHHKPHSSSVPSVFNSHPKAMGGGIPCSLVKARAGNSESQSGLLLNGPKVSSQHLLNGSSPPMVLLLFYFFLIISFLIIIIIIINQ